MGPKIPGSMYDLGLDDYIFDVASVKFEPLYNNSVTILDDGDFNYENNSDILLNRVIEGHD
jgi:hypothetical protein